MSTTPLSRTLQTFKAAPLAFLAFQLPEVSAEIVYNLFDEPEKTPYRILSIVLPYLFVVSFLSAALNFQAVAAYRQGKPFSFTGIVGQVTSRWRLILPVSFLAGLMILLSLMLLAPFYLFVPALVMSEPRLPWSVYLFRSKAIAKRRTWRCVAIVLVLIGTSLATEFFPLPVKIPLALLTGSLLGIYISYSFFDLRDINTA